MARGKNGLYVVFIGTTRSLPVMLFEFLKVDSEEGGRRLANEAEKTKKGTGQEHR
jgi:hypothetical protein